MNAGRLFLLAGALGLFFCAVPTAQAAIADHLVINELATYDGSSYDDWVELYNPTDTDIDLSGWSLQKATENGTTVTRSDLSKTIPAYGYFLVVRNDDDTSQVLKDAADLLVDNFAIADNNSLFLVNSNISIDPTDVNAVYVDLVGWGSAGYFEGAAFSTNISHNNSISRNPDGDDTNNNANDFTELTLPTMQNSGLGDTEDSDLSGSVLVTIYPDAEPVQSITPNSATIVFQVNSDGSANIEYGLTDSYGSASADNIISANTDVLIELSGLECDTIYHYQINAENTAGTDSHATADATFTTLPCGISIDSLVMTRSGARANDEYTDGWEWQFDITVWSSTETELKMQFGAFSGPASLPSGANMRYSVDDGVSWADILADDTYPAVGADISGVDESGDVGRQVSILVQMKVPEGTLAGDYSASYGILTE